MRLIATPTTYSEPRPAIDHMGLREWRWALHVRAAHGAVAVEVAQEMRSHVDRDPPEEWGHANLYARVDVAWRLRAARAAWRIMREHGVFDRLYHDGDHYVVRLGPIAVSVGGL